MWAKTNINYSNVLKNIIPFNDEILKLIRFLSLLEKKLWALINPVYTLVNYSLNVNEGRTKKLLTIRWKKQSALDNKKINKKRQRKHNFCDMLKNIQ